MARRSSRSHIPESMQAVQINAFLPPTSPYTSLRPSHVSTPVPGPDEVLIRITHVSIQQVDLLYARGLHQNNNAKRGFVHPPFILGLDFAGEVVATRTTAITTTSTTPHTDASRDAATRTFRVGDQVMGSHLGAFAEFIAAPTSSLRAVPRSPGSSDVQLSNAYAAALVGGVVSYAALRLVAAAKSDEWVLVTGVPGGLGAVSCQVARAAGARVIALARSEENAKALRGWSGAEVVLASGGDWVGEVRRLTGGKDVSVVIDNVGVVEDALRCVAYGGRIVLVGFAGRGGVMERVAMNRVLLVGARLIGFRFGETSRKDPGFHEEAWEGYLDLLGKGAIRPLLDPRVYSGVEGIPQALQDLHDKKLRGKAVVALEPTATIKARI